MANALTARGDCAKAEPLCRRVLANYETATLREVHKLMETMYYAGNLAEAETLCRRAVIGRERVLGEMHAETLESVNDLGLVLRRQGKLKEAELFSRRGLEGRERLLGRMHPDTLGSVNNLALVLNYQGKRDEAEGLYRRALAGFEAQLGAHHPDTLTSVHNLAVLLYQQGKLQDAEGLYRRALAGKDAQLGAGHPDTLNSVFSLALLLEAKGGHAEARRAVAPSRGAEVNGPGVFFDRAMASSSSVQSEIPSKAAPAVVNLQLFKDRMLMVLELVLCLKCAFVANKNKRLAEADELSGWLIDEVLTNALSYVNIKSDRSLVRSPSSGYHFSLFMIDWNSDFSQLPIGLTSVQVWVESPDQALQFAQLAAIHAHWTAKTEATTEEDTGRRKYRTTTCGRSCAGQQRGSIDYSSRAIAHAELLDWGFFGSIEEDAGSASAQTSTVRINEVEEDQGKILSWEGCGTPEGTTDRWVSRILDLPVFDVAFAQAVKRSPLGNLAFVSAMEVANGLEFVDRTLHFARTLDESIATVFEGRELMLEQFWTLASSVEKAYFESTAVQLGFGLCESAVVARPEDPTASLRKRAAIAALTLKPVSHPKRSKKGPEEASSSTTPLLDREKSEKRRWAARLEEIGLRAGVHAKLFHEFQLGPDLSPAEKIQVLKYGLFLNARERTFSASYLSSCREDHRFLALQATVMADRAKTLKEAIPFPLRVVSLLEEAVLDDKRPTAARVFIWWILCMIFASLRFDDAIHVRPLELEMKEEGLFGVSWQTKVERKRVGTRFVVPNIGFSCSTWLEVGWALFKTLPNLDRDFWIPELNTQASFQTVPPTFARTLQWMKFLSRKAVDEAHQLEKTEQ
ncbi:Kinesin light chain 4 (KLC 4) (Kinesin-like protein 8), partial [Durusdinium trenchii]